MALAVGSAGNGYCPFHRCITRKIESLVETTSALGESPSIDTLGCFSFYLDEL